MTTQIIIEGDLARVVEIQTLHQARLEDILANVENRPPITIFHPRSAIATYWNESEPTHKLVTFLCELGPGIRSIVKSHRRYRLSMPWTYFVFDFSGDNLNRMSLDNGRVYHSNAQVRDLDSRLWTAFLPNVYQDGRICFGSTGVNPNQPLAQRVDSLVNEWYLTNFNDDLISGRTRPFPFAPNPKHSLRPWVDASTREGAGAWVNFPEWQMTGGAGDQAPNYTVRELLANRIDRLAPMTFEEAIPAIPATPTFGRTEEWVRGITPVQRLRLRRALEVIGEEQPDAIAPADPAAATNWNIDEDGGTPV